MGNGRSSVASGIRVKVIAGVCVVAFALLPAAAAALIGDGGADSLVPSPAELQALIAEENLTPAPSGALCSPADDPAVGCGMRIVGFNNVEDRNNNFNLARIGNCAYVSSSAANALVLTNPLSQYPEGVAVIDVSNPAAPRLMEILRSPGAKETLETLHAVDAGSRKVLAIGAYGGRPPAEGDLGAALDIYDASDCAHPRLTSTVYWPDNVHNVTVNPSGTRVYGTRYGAQSPGATVVNHVDGSPLGGAVDLSSLNSVLVMDITDMARPRIITDARLKLPDGTSTACHAVYFNPSETRMYCAGNRVSNAAAWDGREPEYSAWRNAGPSIWDVSDFSAGLPNPQARFVGESDVRGQGGHDAVPATINGKRYMIAANELAIPDCSTAAFPRIWDISDERHPRRVGEFNLPGDDGCKGMHYNKVDREVGAKMALIGWTDAGFHVIDIRDPAHPREVAYFKPGTACHSSAYYNPSTDHIWFACASGFFVAELSPAVRKYMKTRTPALCPNGQPCGSGPEGTKSTAAWSPALTVPADYRMFYCTGLQ